MVLSPLTCTGSSRIKSWLTCPKVRSKLVAEEGLEHRFPATKSCALPTFKHFLNQCFMHRKKSRSVTLVQFEFYGVAIVSPKRKIWLTYSDCFFSLATNTNMYVWKRIKIDPAPHSVPYTWKSAYGILRWWCPESNFPNYYSLCSCPQLVN